MKLELKHLAPYLPHGLQVKKHEGFGGKIIDIDPHNFQIKTDRNGSLMLMERNGIGGLPFDLMQLVLHPLSSLTKEIEYKGVGFVPMKKMLEIIMECEWNDKHWKLTKPIHGGEAVKNKHTNSTIHVYPSIIYEKNTWESMQILFKWHFNVFGLIEAGLAIDKSQLTTK